MILASGMPNSSLSLTSSTRFSIFGSSSPNVPMRVKPRLGPYHEVVQVGAEQVDTGIGNAAELIGLEGGTGNNKRAAEPVLVARLAVTVIGHVLGARRAHVVLDILVEDGERARGEVRHHVFAEEAARISQPVRVLVGRGVEQDARVLCGPGGEHHNTRRLYLPFLLLVVVLDAGDASAFSGRQNLSVTLLKILS